MRSYDMMSLQSYGCGWRSFCLINRFNKLGDKIKSNDSWIANKIYVFDFIFEIKLLIIYSLINFSQRIFLF